MEIMERIKPTKRNLYDIIDKLNWYIEMSIHINSLKSKFKESKEQYEISEKAWKDNIEELLKQLSPNKLNSIEKGVALNSLNELLLKDGVSKEVKSLLRNQFIELSRSEISKSIKMLKL